MFVKDPLKAKVVGFLASGIIYIILYFYNVYNSFKISKNINKVINLIHDKMNNVNTFIKKFRLI